MLGNVRRLVGTQKPVSKHIPDDGPNGLSELRGGATMAPSSKLGLAREGDTNGHNPHTGNDVAVRQSELRADRLCHDEAPVDSPLSPQSRCHQRVAMRHDPK